MYSKLERKYKKTVPELVAYVDEIKKKLEFYSNKEETLANALKDLHDKESKCNDLSCELNKSRKKHLNSKNI